MALKILLTENDNNKLSSLQSKDEYMKEQLEGHLSGQDPSGLKKEKRNDRREILSKL